MIKFFESTDAGAPTLNNAVGSMIAVLDACLITGYNSKAVTSITVTSGVATVVCTGHGYANTYGKKIRIAGATPAGLNVDTDIADVTTNGFTFLCPGVADGAATGTLTAKYAPLDCIKQYTGTNKAMYKRSNVTATACMLRIDDNVVGQSCRALMVNSATDVDTYTGPAPLGAQIADGLGQYWSKGYNSASAAGWYIVADELYFYLFVQSYSASPGSMPHSFGDIIDFKPASVLGCTLAGPSSVGSYLDYAYYAANSGVPSWLIAGAKDGISTSKQIQLEGRVANYGFSGPTYPSDVDGGLVIQYPALIKEGTTPDVHLRGIQPGWAMPLAKIDTAIPNKTQISNLVGSPRTFLVAQCSTGPGQATHMVGLIDLTGPWR